MTRNQVAARVAQRKAHHPEMFCPVPRCLWRTNGERCPRHQVASLSAHPSVALVEEMNETIQVFQEPE